MQKFTAVALFADRMLLLLVVMISRLLVFLLRKQLDISIIFATRFLPAYNITSYLDTIRMYTNRELSMVDDVDKGVD